MLPVFLSSFSLPPLSTSPPPPFYVGKTNTFTIINPNKVSEFTTKDGSLELHGSLASIALKVLLGQAIKGGMAHVTTLNLTNNQIGHREMPIIAEVVKHLPLLDALYLSSNEDIGAYSSMTHFVSIAQSLPGLKKLYFAGHNIYAEGMECFAEASKHLGKLELLNINGESKFVNSRRLWEHFAEAASHLKALTSLHVSRRVGNDMACFCGAFKHLSSLRYLDLSFNAFGSKGMEHFAAGCHHLTSLTDLDLGGNCIANEGMAHFLTASRHLSSLSSLTLDNNGIGSDGIKHLMNSLPFLPALRNISLDSNEIDDEAMLHFANPGMMAIESLFLSYNPIHAVGLCRLAVASVHMGSLKTLWLKSIGLKTEMCDDDDHRYGIDAQGMIYLGRAQFPSLSELDLDDNNIGFEGMRQFVTASKNFGSLRDLSLSSNKIGNEGMQFFAKASKYFTSLEKLNVADNDLTDMTPLKKSLRHLTSLKNLYLELNEIEEEGEIFFFKLLEQKEQKEKSRKRKVMG